VLPDVAFTVTCVAPAAAELPAVNVPRNKPALPDALKEAVTPAGSPEAESG
jgi:hypothetical protein